MIIFFLKKKKKKKIKRYYKNIVKWNGYMNCFDLNCYKRVVKIYV